jgi:hypothetical protein
MNPYIKSALIADVRHLLELTTIRGVSKLDTYAEWELAYAAITKRLPETQHQKADWDLARRLLRWLMSAHTQARAS